MGRFLRALYFIMCCFVLMFALGIAAYYGNQAPTFSQSHLSLLPYVAIISSIVTVFLVIIVAIGFGMWHIYTLIFGRR